MGKLEHMMKVVLLLLIGVLAVSAAPTWTKTLTTQLSDVGGHTTTSCHCNGCSADKHTVAMADNATACAQACIAANNANAGSCKISLFDADRNVPPMGTKCFLYSEHPTADNTNPNAGVSSQGLSRFTCWQPADTTVSTHAPTNACTMSTLAQNNFDNRGDTTLSTSTTYQYTLSAGYTCKLSGWTHTRNYHKGFLRNTAGNGQAEVSGLVAGQNYQWRIYQYASSFEWSNTNPITVNGVNKGATSSTTNTNGGPTLTGTSTADSNGKITFVFTRTNHHTALSGIAMCPA